MNYVKMASLGKESKIHKVETSVNHNRKKKAKVKASKKAYR